MQGMAAEIAGSNECTKRDHGGCVSIIMYRMIKKRQKNKRDCSTVVGAG